MVDKQQESAQKLDLLKLSLDMRMSDLSPTSSERLQHHSELSSSNGNQKAGGDNTLSASYTTLPKPAVLTGEPITMSPSPLTLKAATFNQKSVIARVLIDTYSLKSATR